METILEIDINRMNQEELGSSASIYALLDEGNTFLAGCGLWDRENMPHTRAVKDATPGVVFRVEKKTGKVVGRTEPLANIVYPLVDNPRGAGCFAGCRTGDAYLIGADLSARHLGSFGQGVYGVEYSAKLDRFLVGGRDGTLYVLDRDWQTVQTVAVADDRLWNLHMDWDDQSVWATCYNRHLYKVDILSGEIPVNMDLGAGSVTYLERLANGMMAVGCFGKKIFLLQDGRIVDEIPVESPVCFLRDLPHRGLLVATGYRGQVWVLNYQGVLQDKFLLDTKENNPVWTGTQWAGEPDRMAFAWANGIIRVLEI
jgi:outer membrane protein assembly factor BamB